MNDAGAAAERDDGGMLDEEEALFVSSQDFRVDALLNGPGGAVFHHS